MGRVFGIRYRALLMAGALGAVLCQVDIAYAQALPGTPPPPAAGQVALPTRDDLHPVQASPPPEPSHLSVVGDIERAPCPLADARFAGITVPVNNVTFNNLKGVTPADMRQAWAQYAGTRQPVAVLCEIRDAAATILRDRGYLAAVQVPTQRIENGDIRMEMLYARVTAVRARGQTKGAEAMIARYLGRLTEDPIFDRNRAERYLLLARDLPGYNVQLTLKPAGTGPGELVGEVTVIRRPYSADFSIQNLSSEAVGRWGMQLHAQFFGLTGMGDATSVGIYSTSDFEEQQILQLGHEFRLGSEGLKISSQFTYAWTEPALGNVTAATPNLTARTLFATLAADYPLVRRQAKDLTVGGGLDFVNQKVDFGTFGPLSRDRLRVLFLRASGDATDLKHVTPRWRVSGNLELRKGLDILDATNCGASCPNNLGPSRTDGRATAMLVRASGSAEVALGKMLSLAFAPRLQLAFDPVLAFEEYSVGNYTIGRGFDPGAISGDSGYGASVELRTAAIKVGRNNDLLLHPYIFADGARTWNLRDALPSEGLLSLGGGMRAELTDRLRLDATMAIPTLENTVLSIRNSARFLVTLTTRLLPWSNH